MRLAEGQVRPVLADCPDDWFEFLAQQPQREEVNFWSPSDYYTFHGTPGGPFFFKLKSTPRCDRRIRLCRDLHAPTRVACL